MRNRYSPSFILADKNVNLNVNVRSLWTLIRTDRKTTSATFRDECGEKKHALAIQPSYFNILRVVHLFEHYMLPILERRQVDWNIQI